MATNYNKVIQEVRMKLVEVNQRYKLHVDTKQHFKHFEPGNLVMVRIRKERRPHGTSIKV